MPWNIWLNRRLLQWSEATISMYAEQLLPTHISWTFCPLMSGGKLTKEKVSFAKNKWNKANHSIIRAQVVILWINLVSIPFLMALGNFQVMTLLKGIYPLFSVTVHSWNKLP